MARDDLRRDELKREVAKQTGLTETQADGAVRAVFDTIERALADGQSVTISGFGSFRVAERPARDGLHPQTRKPMKIEARKSPAFKPGARLKRTVNGEDPGDEE
jgi:DNA-binding protein HU-beta